MGRSIRRCWSGMRNRLRASERPRRLFEDTKVAARAAGAIKGRARVLDSTPVYDAVATQDTVTQLRAAIRKVLAALGAARSPLAAAVRAVLRRDDDYAGPGKPPCDWDDPAAREALVDELVNDALAALAALEGQAVPLPPARRWTCWRWWPARTSSRVRTGCSGSPGGSPPTG